MGIDATLQIKGSEVLDSVPRDSRLFASLYFDIINGNESTTEMLSTIYDINLDPIINVDYEDSEDAWQDPLILSKVFTDLLKAIESEGSEFIGMPLEGYLLRPDDVDMMKVDLREMAQVCKDAHDAGKQIRILLC